jgi:hypothetical protein
MTQKNKVFGIVLLSLMLIMVMAVSGVAFEYEGIICSTDPTDYVYYNDSLALAPNGNNFMDFDDMLNVDGGYAVLYLDNLTYSVSSAKPGIYSLNDSQDGIISQQVADTTWRIHDGVYTDTGFSSPVSESYNLTTVFDIVANTKNITITNNSAIYSNNNFGYRHSGTDLGMLNIETGSGTTSLNGIYLWNGTSCPAAIAEGEPLFTPSWVGQVVERTNTTISLLVENSNITALSTANLIYGNDNYTTDISLVNNSYVEFNTSFLAPFAANNTTQFNFYFEYELEHENLTYTDSTTTIESQFVEWDLANYPRVNITVIDAIGGGYVNTVGSNDSDTTFSTTSRDLYFRYNQTDLSHSVTVSPLGLSEATESLNFTVGYLNHFTYNVYTSNSFNISFYNEITNEPIEQNFSVEFISDDYSVNVTAVLGVLYIDLLTPSDYVIRYQSEGYGRLRQYYTSLNNNSYTDLILYSIQDDNSTETTVNVYDQLNLNPVEGAMVYLQRYFIDDNSYKTVAMYQSDVAGASYFDVEHDNEFYKFQVDYPLGTIKTVTNPFYISETTLNLYISLSDSIADTFFSYNEADYSLTFDNNTNLFTVVYSDAAAEINPFCLYIKQYGQYSLTTINSTCSSSSSGTLQLPPGASGTSYAVLTGTTAGGEEQVIASAWTEIMTDTLNAGIFGLFLTAMIFLIFVFLSSYHIFAPILGGIGIIFAKIIGILALPWPTVMLPAIMGVMVALILKVYSK